MITFGILFMAAFSGGLTALAITLILGIKVTKWRRELEEARRSSYADARGFEVEGGDIYMDDSDKGEFVVRGFTR